MHAAISIGFALPVYETMEQNGIVDDLVFVVKDGNVKSEQVLKILVMATSGSADMGELYRIALVIFRNLALILGNRSYVTILSCTNINWVVCTKICTSKIYLL